MTTFITPQDEYLKVAQVFHWATKEDYALWFTGQMGRHRRTEVILPRLAKKYQNPKTRNRSLFSLPYGKRLIYICPRKKRQGDIHYKIEHGLCCTDCMVRFHRSSMQAEIIEERRFVGCGSIPDFGVKFPKTMLLVEYSSKDNFHQHNVIKNKIAAYKRNLWQIEEKFGKKGIPLFVIDISRERLAEFLWAVTENYQRPLGLPAYFVDYETFKNVSIGKALSSSIYFFGEDGQSYPLLNNA